MERIAVSRTLALHYRQKGVPGDRGVFQQRRTVQVQLAVAAPDPARAPGLTRVDVYGMTAQVGGRSTDVEYYGGKLENGAAGVLLRGYVYVSAFPKADEIRSMEGEIVAYEKSDDIVVTVPLDQPDRTAESEGVRVRVRELAMSDGIARITLTAEGPRDSVLIVPGEDGNHGVSLVDRQQRTGAPGGGSLSQPRTNWLDYRITVQNVKGPPAAVRVRLTKQHGERRVWPFRLEHIPLPARITPALR